MIKLLSLFRYFHIFAFLVFLAHTEVAFAAEWQWSVPVGEGRAFLWIPPNCEHVRAVVVGQNNMLEEGVFEHPTMRRELAKLGIAEVWVAPYLDAVFRFDLGAGERFDAMMKSLAEHSGYSELASAPVVPIGHSACASYPWNFAAWNPGRTLALISLKGDAPLTTMTGSGKPNPDWSDRTIVGVPALMVMGEYEWIEGRLQPAADYIKKFPATPIAVLADPGRGHFDCSDQLVEFLTLFIRKSVEQRLPTSTPAGTPPTLIPIDPRRGWLVERPKLNQPRTVAAAPFARYTGDSHGAFWCFDEEMALTTQNYRVDQIGKKPQLLGYVQNGKTLPQTATHNQVSLHFQPLEDGITFKIGTTFLNEVEAGSANLARWTQLPVGTPLGHPIDAASIRISRITGPVEQVSADIFRVHFNRTASTSDRRHYDVWLLAEQPGDGVYKSAVQQALLTLAPNKLGRDQQIDFPPIADQRLTIKTLKLGATSRASLPISYYVREGPAEIDGDTLHFTALPPRAAYPVEVTVVAWQWGRAGESPVKTAEPVTRTFRLGP